MSSRNAPPINLWGEALRDDPHVITHLADADHVDDSSRDWNSPWKARNYPWKLVETILETLREGDIEKEVEDYGEFCAKVHRVLAGIDLSLEDAKNSVQMGTSPKLHSR